MAIDTKTTAGGVVILFLSGTGGYLATSASKGETTVPTSSSLEDKQTKSGNPEENSNQKPTDIQHKKKTEIKIKEKIKDSKFLLIEEQEESDNKWDELAKAITTKTPETTKDKLKEFCKTNLEKIYSKETEEDFKEVIKKCTTLITFKTRAEKLSIELIKEETGNSEPWKGRFDSLKEPNAKILANQSGETITWPSQSNTVTSHQLKDYCKAVEKLNWTTVKITNQNGNSIEREWKNYLKGCAKSENVVKDFWTGQ